MTRELHDEFRAFTWRVAAAMVLQTVILLGGMHFMLTDVKSDLRELLTALSHLSPQPK